MSHIAEIASEATRISGIKHAETSQNVEMSVLKKSIDVEKMLQQQMISMMQQISPHLGSNVNVTA